MRILIHKADHLGDFVLALPALWEVRQKFGAAADIHLLVRGPNVEWQALLPWLGEMHPLSHPRYERTPDVPKLKLSFQALKQAHQLRHHQFDWGIDLVSTRNDLLGKWLLKAAGCHATSGPDGAHSWMLSRRYPEPQSHQTTLLASRFPDEWGISGTASPEVFMPAELRWQATGGSHLTLAPFAGTQAKQWPESYWIELYQKLSELGAVKLLIPQPDLARHATFISQFPESSLSIVKTIAETLSVLRNSRGVVVLDTAVAHYAWLTGTPFVQIFSGTAKKDRWAPVSGGVTIQRTPDCYPCQSEVCLQARHECMEAVTVNEVLDHFMKVVA